MPIKLPRKSCHETQAVLSVWSGDQSFVILASSIYMIEVFISSIS